MKLGIIGHKRFESDGQHFRSRGGFGRSLEALTDYFDEITIFAPVHYAAEPVGYEIESPNFRYVPLPPYTSRFEEIRGWPHTYRILCEEAAECDLLHVRAGSVVGLAGLCAARRLHKPYYLWIAGDVLAIRQTLKPFAAVFPAGPLTWATETLTRRLARGQFCFATGEALRDVYRRYTPHVHVTAETLLSARDLVSPRSRCEGERVHVLFVGRLNREKGLAYLVNALALTRSQVLLDIVGAGPEEAALRAQVAARGLQDRVTFHGYVPVGERLWQHYDTADIFILPSLSEGTPKVILEAQARAVPVIASNVGGIPTLIQDRSNGMLVTPGAPQAIASAIDEIIANAALRQQLIERGLATARRFTMEVVTEEQIRLLNEHFGLRLQRAGAVVT